ncbi:hypothetical protein ACFYXS_28300 [Streptomyces sp. NPDC002574]|uniref:hypothetical protein n=1 Tax=Streptomyces sp. NPDC002574 TaxID=3364652 RepID=UPI003695704A
MVHIPTGRRGALAAASAAAVCLGAFAALGPDCESAGAGWVAAGAPGPAGSAAVNVPRNVGVGPVPPGDAAAPPRLGSPTPQDRPGAPAASGTPVPSGSATAPDPGTTAAATPTATAPVSGDPGPTPGPGSATASGSPPPAATPSASPGAPARLVVSAVVRSAAEDRWCENVTVTLANTGDDPAPTGTLVFGTHIIGLLGLDWATIESRDPVPAPLAGGAALTETWTVCVDAWRVPPGMHVETRDVSVRVP